MAYSHWSIRTPQLLIRDVTVGDASAEYVAGLNDKEHMRFSSQRLNYHTLETSRAYVRSFEETPHYFLALELQDGAHPVIGSITAYFNDDRSSAYLGVFLVTSTAGRGLGNDGWSAVTEQFATQGELL